MKEKMYININNNQENEYVEFKENCNDKTIYESICSFLNTKGGIIYINVTNKGVLIKNTFSEKSIGDIYKKITNVSNSGFNKSINNNVFVEKGQMEGYVFLKIIVKEANDKVYQYMGVAYKRNSDRDDKYTADEIQEIQNKIKRYDYSNDVHENIGIEAINEEAYQELFNRYFKLEKNKGKNKKDYQNNKIKLLNEFGLLRNERPNTTCLIWLGDYDKLPEELKVKRQIQYHYDDFKNKIEYKKINTDPFIFSYQWILTEIDKRNNPIQEYSLFRNDELKQYDIKSVEELIINAIAHRNWNINLNIYIRQNPNGLTIQNPGDFVEDKEKIINEAIFLHKRPEYKNNNLSEFLNKIDLMERGATGFEKSFYNQNKRGLDIKIKIVDNTTFVHMEGFNEKAKIFLKFLDNYHNEIIENSNKEVLILLYKIYIGKNKLEVDITKEQYYIVKEYVDNHKSGRLKLKNYILSKESQFKKDFTRKHSSKDLSLHSILDFAKSVDTFNTSDIYELFDKPESTIRGMILRLKKTGDIILIEKNKYKIFKPNKNKLK